MQKGEQTEEGKPQRKATKMVQVVCPHHVRVELHRLARLNATTKTRIIVLALRHIFELLEAERIHVFRMAAEEVGDVLPAPPKLPLLNFPKVRLPSEMWTKEQMETTLMAAEAEDAEHIAWRKPT